MSNKKYTVETEINKLYGLLRIIEFKEAYSKEGKQYKARAVVICEGSKCLDKNPFEVDHTSLIQKKTTSCGCLRRIYTSDAEIGKIYGFLRVIEFKNAHTDSKNNKYHRSRAVVVCEREGCNNKEPFEVYQSSLVSGTTVSCGCLRIDKTTTYGLAKHPYYHICSGVLARCNNPKNTLWEYYGGRVFNPIKCYWTNPSEMCKWLIDNLPPRKEGESLNRFPNINGYYEPGNLEWADKKKQREDQRPHITNYNHDLLLLENQKLKIKIEELEKNKMSDTLGSLIDKLATTNTKMFVNQDLLYEIRRMTVEQFKEKYSSDKGLDNLFECLQKCCDLNYQRSQLMTEVDQKVIEMIEAAKNGEELDNGKFLQRQHKTY